MILTALFALTLGFWWGRRVGQSEGKKLGLQLAVFRLKSQALKKQSCPVCGLGLKQEPAAQVTKDKSNEILKQEAIL